MDISRIEDLMFRMAVRLEAMQAITYEKEWKPEVDAVRKMLWNAKPVSPEVVSREAIKTLVLGKIFAPGVTVDQATDAIYSLQLPAPAEVPIPTVVEMADAI